MDLPALNPYPLFLRCGGRTNFTVVSYIYTNGINGWSAAIIVGATLTT